MTRRVVTFIGNNGVGAISNAEFRVGDQVSYINANGNSAPGLFAEFVVTDGEVLQFSAIDLSSDTFYALLT